MCINDGKYLNVRLSSQLLIKAVQSICVETKIIINIGGKRSRRLTLTKQGVGQLSLLSPVLLRLYLDHVIKECQEESIQIVSNSENTYFHLLGAVQLVDVSSKLPGLKYRQGLTRWIPASRDMKGYTTYDDVPEKWQTQIRPQMFPPAPEDVGKFNLERW